MGSKQYPEGLRQFAKYQLFKHGKDMHISFSCSFSFYSSFSFLFHLQPRQLDLSKFLVTQPISGQLNSRKGVWVEFKALMAYYKHNSAWHFACHLMQPAQF